MDRDELAARVRERLTRLADQLAAYDEHFTGAQRAGSVEAWRESLAGARRALELARGELAAFAPDLAEVAADPALAATLAKGTGITSLQGWAASARALLERSEGGLYELEARGTWKSPGKA